MLIGALIVAACTRVATAQGVDRVRGQVLSETGAGVQGATVIATAAQTAFSITVGVDSATGRFEASLPASVTGEYILYATAPDRSPTRIRLARKGGDTTFVVELRLRPVTNLVPAVEVRATRNRPDRGAGTGSIGRFPAGSDPTDQTFAGVSHALDPSALGDATAMAALLPGLSTSSGGISAFGLGGESSITTLNGAAFPSAQLPRDAAASARFATSVWDPSLGGASGVRTVWMLSPGTNVTNRRMRTTADVPQLQFPGAHPRGGAGEFRSATVSVGGDGPIRLERLYYNFGVQAGKRDAAYPVLASATAAQLAAAGTSADSVNRLMEALSMMGIQPGADPATQSHSNASVILRLDWRRARRDGDPAPPPSAWLIAFASASRSTDPSPLLATASLGSRRQARSAFAQFGHSAFFGPDRTILNELTSSLTVATTASGPTNELPSGIVQVTSRVDDQLLTRALAFGGAGTGSGRTRTWSWEGRDEVGFLFRGRPGLPLKLTLQARLEGSEVNREDDAAGAYTFSSIEDMLTGTPSSFTRTLSAPAANAVALLAGGSFGGSWYKGGFALTGGVRADAYRSLSNPALNGALQQAFGRRTDRVSIPALLSPRIGFVWHPSGQATQTISRLPTATLIRGGSQVRGGIGVFRDDPSMRLLQEARASTGLAPGARNLVCSGSATPLVQWGSFGSAPVDECRDGYPSLVDTARRVVLFGRARPTSSRRMTIGFTNSRYRHFDLDATWSRHFQRPGTVDLNLRPEPYFVLSDGRPVFVPLENIVPSTGLVSTAGAGQVPGFGRVVERVSDLESGVFQLTAQTTTALPFRAGIALVGYTYMNGNTDFRGFDHSTPGDPTRVERAALGFPRHRATVQLGHRVSRVGVTSVIQVASGSRYTPMIGRDINGDGLGNDRAFIDETAGGVLSSGARKCLSRQAGEIAAANSCVGPWSVSTSLNLFTVPERNQRTTIRIALASPLELIDRMLHGSSTLGWEGTPAIDPVLYHVRQFDPASNSFVYELNPRFGPQRSEHRQPGTTPRLTLDVAVDLGRPREEQLLDQSLRLRLPLVGTRAPVDSIMYRYMSQPSTSGFVDIYAFLLRNADSLALSSTQIDSLVQRQTVLRSSAVTIYRRLAEDLHRLPSSFDPRAALLRVSGASEEMWVAIREERGYLARILSGAQVELLPRGFQSMLKDPDYNGRFIL